GSRRPHRATSCGCCRWWAPTSAASGAFEDERHLHGGAVLGDLAVLDRGVLLQHLDAGDATQRLVGPLEGIADRVLPAVRRGPDDLRDACHCHASRSSLEDEDDLHVDPVLDDLSALLLLARRHLRSQGIRVALTAGGVACGVALVVAIRVINASTLAAFTDAIEDLAGTAALQVRGAGPFAEAVADRVRAVPGVDHAVPIVTATFF